MSTRKTCDGASPCRWCGPTDFAGHPIPGKEDVGQCYTNATQRCCVDTGGGGHGSNPEGRGTVCAANQECCTAYEKAAPACYSPSEGQTCCNDNYGGPNVCEKGTASCHMGYSDTSCYCCSTTNETCGADGRNPTCLPKAFSCDVGTGQCTEAAAGVFASNATCTTTCTSSQALLRFKVFHQPCRPAICFGVIAHLLTVVIDGGAGLGQRRGAQELEERHRPVRESSVVWRDWPWAVEPFRRALLYFISDYRYRM